MSGSVNKVILVGNLGRDPEVRRLNSGEPVVNLRLATTETWRDKGSGERKERTEWHNVVIFNENLAKVAEQYLKKGSTVYIEGQLQTRKYTDKDGAERYSTEIVLQRYRGEMTLLGGRGQAAGALEDDGGSYAGGGGGSYAGGGGSGGRGGDFGRASPMDRKPAPAGGGRGSDLDDDIPF